MPELETNEVLTAYQTRLDDRAAALLQDRARDRMLSNVRLLIFAAGLATAFLALFPGLFSVFFVIPFLAAFVAVVNCHDRVLRECERLERAVEFYERGIDRIQDRWPGRGKSGLRFRDPEHPYAEDLDIFGRGSLFERLCTARTSAGEECLARWLLAPAAPDEVRRRQESVTELRDLLDIREELDLLAVVTQQRVEPGFLQEWAAARVEPVPFPIRAVLVAVAAAVIVFATLWALGASPLPLFAAITIGQLFYAPYRRKAEHATKGLGMAALELGFLGPVLAHLERDSYRSGDLLEIRNRILGAGGDSAVAAIKRIQTLDGYWHMRASIVTGVVMELLFLSPHVASATARWRQQFGCRVGEWISAVGEFEALSALASYAHENPEHTFAKFSSRSPYLNASQLSHPLLPAGAAVPNDIVLDSNHRLYIVSGSNMSGKSTLLRSIGVNAVLAQAGAPVRAVSLELSSVRIGASIRTGDSLQEGISRFYAEIRRLHSIVKLAESGEPVIFLLDEILHGTNSHDRRIGAEAVVRALLERGAVGLMTTHDLALTRIAEEPGLSALNVHFQDELVEGKMRFDYTLRPGVVEKSNALELMRAVGLKV